MFRRGRHGSGGLVGPLIVPVLRVGSAGGAQRGCREDAGYG